MLISEEAWGQTPAGELVRLFTLVNANGMTLKLSDYGATITSLTAPDVAGNFDDVVLGYDTLAEYVRGTFYLGAVIGRYANRIAEGRFTLKGREYQLAINNGRNAIHGGRAGFDRLVWSASPSTTKCGPGVVFAVVSPDGHEGFPGEVTAEIEYRLTDENEVCVRYEARTTKPTPINMTQHSYFNLNGGKADILGQELMIAADAFTPVDEHKIPTGEILSVAGSPFDFRDFHAIGANMEMPHEQLRLGGGFDHNWVLADKAGEMRLAAEVRDSLNGRWMQVFTTEPGVQFYAGNALDGRHCGKGVRLQRHMGLCLETQHFPDSPNKAYFPSTILDPDDVYRSTTLFKFGAA